MSESVCEIGVFERGQSTQTLPVSRITYEEACNLVNVERIAKWANNRRKNVIMLTDRIPRRLRGKSCTVNARTMWDFALGKPYAIAIVEKWAFRA